MIAVLRFLFVIPFAFVAACFAAAFALLWPFIELSPGWRDDPFVLLDLAVGFTAQAGQVGAVALVPWAIFMAVSEIFRLSSLLLHAGAGALAGLALSRHWYGEAVSPAVQTAMVVGGLGFFLVYWLVAGRRAGHWRSRPPSANTPEPENNHVPPPHLQP